MKVKIIYKIIIVLLVLTIFLSFTSCSSLNSNKEANKDNTTEKENSTEQENKFHEEELAKKYKKNLIGFWHNGPYTGGAGFLDHFEFMDDGIFVFKYNEFDGENRIIGYSGNWNIIHGNLLLLNITSRTVIRGGYYTDEVASETTEYVLRGGTVKKIKLEEQETVIYPLGKIQVSDKEEYFFPVMMKIGGKWFWKFYSDGEDLIID